MKELPDWFTGTVRVEPYVTGPNDPSRKEH